MIRLKRNRDGLILEQETIPPLVYLDTWVYRRIISDNNKREQFTNLFHNDFGTLCLSDVNIIEIVRSGRKEICEIADCISNTQFVLFEDDILNNSIIKPLNIYINEFHDKNDMIKFFFDFKKTRNNLNNEEDFIKKFNEIKNNTHMRINALDAYKKCDKNTIYSAQEVSQIWIGYVINIKTMKMDDHHYRDLWHLCKPIVHCDIVTMDKTWKTFINQTIPNLSHKIICDKRGLGMQMLFDKIRNFKRENNNGN